MPMIEDFGENVAPTAAITAILNSYPFSIGLLREILQNSDDAGAQKQIFILDRRTHPFSSIYDAFLAGTQGPALLAFNDELIKDEDWRAFRTIHRSSKTTDTSKIGKYGIGFRSCYHITDTPHILSGKHLAILDPQQDFSESGGVKLPLADVATQYRDHLNAFDSFVPSSEFGQPFEGSIFRLPLRASPSQICNKAYTPDEISDLLRSFALEELNIALLFLRNVSSIGIFEISMDGRKTKVASATIDRTNVESYRDSQIRKATVITRVPESSEERSWRIIHAPFSETQAITDLTARLGGNPETTLSQHKLSPAVDLAFPLGSPGLTDIGRLFTFLPLPLKTRFPIHINALFSLTQSRQNLRNGGEVGIVKQSDDHALIEWNNLLFETYIPQAWATLLETLTKHDQIIDLFNAWPLPQSDIQSGDYFYWRNIVSNVTRYAIELPIWPVYGQNTPAFQYLETLLLADHTVSADILDALVRIGIPLTQPPPHVTEIIVKNHGSKIRLLSPQLAHEQLLNCIEDVRQIDDSMAETILEYLLSTNECQYIAGLPLIRSIGGVRVSLESRATPTSATQTSRTLLSDIDEELFGAYDPDAISLQSLRPEIRAVLLAQGVEVLQIAALDSHRVLSYLKASSYASQNLTAPSADQIGWLNRFWSRVRTAPFDQEVFNDLYLVPTLRGLQRPIGTFFDAEAEPEVAQLFEMLGVLVLHPDADEIVRTMLRSIQPSSNIHALLSALPETIDVEFTEEQATILCNHFVRYLPSSSHKNGPIATKPTLRSRLRSIPVFPVISIPSNIHPMQSSRSSLASFATVRGVDPNDITVLPHLSSTSWIDLRVISPDILQYLDPNHPSPISAGEMQDLMLQHLTAQSSQTQLSFVQYLVTNFNSVPQGTFTRLSKIDFVLALDGRKHAPESLVDPSAPVAQLFPGASSSIPDTSTSTSRTLVDCLCELRLFIANLTLPILQERIQFIANGNAPEPEHLAQTLIQFVNDLRFDCRNLFNSTVTLDTKWLPTAAGLQSPRTCRDPKSHLGRTYLLTRLYQ